MKLFSKDPESNQLYFLEWKNGYVAFRQDWSQFFFWQKDRWNWYTFTLFWLEIENDYQLGAWEVNFMILGVGFLFRHTYDDNTELWKELNQRVEEIDGKLGETADADSK